MTDKRLPVNEECLLESSGDSGSNPKAWATLTIDLRLMTPEQRQMVSEAVGLLADAGVTFDTGIGFGGYDWELDFSLRGADLKIHPLRCFQCNRRGFPTAYWTTLERAYDKAILRSVYCSAECQEAYETTKDEGEILPGYENVDLSTRVLSREVSPAWDVS